MNIVKMFFGSHLYGTNTPESDRDYKGIFLPSKEQIYFGKVPKSIRSDTKKDPNAKNTPNDIDCEMYSLHYFLKMAFDGDTAAIDMLHCPKKLILESSPVWDEIVRNREKFYTKNLKTLVEYARGQAAKYGVKGSRLADAKNVLDFLNQFEPKVNDPKLKEIWDQLPEGPHISKLPADRRTGLRMYEVCNRKSQETAKACYCREMVQKFYDEYGHRAKDAAKNKGLDWKAISHAVRAGAQLKEILSRGTIKYPLAEAEFIRDVKLGKYSYFCIAIYLDDMVDKLEELNKKSSLPDKPDHQFWNNFLMETLDKWIMKN